MKKNSYVLLQVSKKELPLHPQSRANALIKKFGLVVQLVRIHACHAWGRGFESRPDRNNILKPLKVNHFQGLFFLGSQSGDQSNNTL